MKNPVPSERDAASLLAFSVHERSSSVRSTGLVAIGTLASRILGLFRDVITAQYFPPEVRDAFVIAFRLPNVFRRIFGEGAFSATLLPAIAGHQAAGAEAEAQRLAASMFAVLMSGASAACLLGIVFMEPILGALASGEAFMSVPGKFDLAVGLSRIMLGFLALASLYGYCMAALHAVGRFAIAAFAPVLFNGAMIGAAYLWPRGYGRPEAMAETLAWSVLIGGALQAVVVAVAASRTALWPRLRDLRWTGDGLAALASGVPIALSSNLFQFTALANLWFASRLPQGSLSHLYFADRILELPLSLFAASLGAAVLPGMSRAWAEGKNQELGGGMTLALRSALFIGALNAVGMATLAEPIVDALFVGREFSLAEGAQTARVLQIYSIALIAAGAARILSQGFYAARMPSFPAIAAAVSFASHLTLAGPLMKAFGLDGVAAATAASQTIFATMLAFGFRSRIAALDGRGFARSLPRLAACSAAAAAGAQMYIPFSARIGPSFPRLAAVLAAAACAGAAYVGVAAATRSPELRELGRALARKRAATEGEDDD